MAGVDKSALPLRFYLQSEVVVTDVEPEGESPVRDGGWREWFGRREAGLMLFARQIAATREEAADAVQEGFLRFWRAGGGKERSAGYLFACVRSAALDVRRAGRSRRRRERAVMQDAGAMLAGPAEMDERRGLVERALGQLPREQREVVVLKVWSGLTFAEIGEALGVSANTAASRYRYAIGRLQGLLPAEVIHE